MFRIINSISKIRRVVKFQPHDVKTEQGISDERYRRIFLTGGATAVVKILTALINLFVVPLTVNYLGSERYGLWMAISSVLALLSFADLGLGNGLVNAIAKAHGRNNPEEAKIAVSSTFFLLLFIAIIFFFVFVLIYPFVSWEQVFNVKSAIAIKESGPTMAVLVIMLFFNMPLGIIQRVQDGYQEGFKFQIWQFLGSLISFIFLLICIYLKCSLPWLVFALSFGQLIAIILNGVNLFTHKRAYLAPKYRYFSFEIGKKLINSGLVFFLLGIFTLIANASDGLVIAQTLGASSVSGYEIVKKVFLFSMFTQFIIQPLWPAFAEASESGDIKWIKKTLQKALLISIISGAIITLPLLIFGKQIIILWVGIGYEPSWSLLLGFYCFICMANYGGVMSTFLNSGNLISKQTVFIGLASVSSVFVKIFLSIKFGVSGIIWATVLCYCIFYVLPSYKLAFNHINRKQHDTTN
jgi:O-antigen/teichoic acid export membrane protein